MRVSTRPLVFVATAVVLVAFALGGWVPVARTMERARPVAQAEKAGIDVDAVVDKVHHRVTPAEDGSLAADDEHYRARFDATGFGFTPDARPSRFGVSLRGVQRGADSLALVPDAWRGEANVAVRGLGSGMTERVTARAGELEWDVVLDRPLPGTGDLRIEADLRGLDGSPVRIAGGSAWRFPLGGGGAARMGEVVVKDATGAELHRALPQVRGDAVHLAVPASVLAGARYPLTIDPTVGPELAVNSSVPAAAQSSPAVAWNGTDFLVVWDDARAPAGIYATRVSGGGSVLDPAGIYVGAGVTPEVAWNGSNFLVVWEAGNIYGARVSSAGTVLDPAGIVIGTGGYGQFDPAVASDGSNFLVVWTRWELIGDEDEDYDVYGARVNAAGTVLDPAGFPLRDDGSIDHGPAVAWNGRTYLVVWVTGVSLANLDIRGARVNAAGSVLDPAPSIPISSAANGQLAPAVAASGADFLVVWQDIRSGAGYDIYGTGVGANGTVAQPAGIPISTAAGHQEAPDLAVRYHFLVAWRDRRSGNNYDVYATRVSPAGVLEEPSGFPVSSAASPSDEGPAAVTGGPGATWGVAYPRFVPGAPHNVNRVFLRSVSPK